MKIIFQIDGGIGKSVMATAVCKAIKTQYPKDQLIVITGYPDVFLCNPYVEKVLNFNNLNYFYQDNIEGQEVKMMIHNPYLGHSVRIRAKRLRLFPKTPANEYDRKEQRRKMVRRVIRALQRFCYSYN